MNGGVDDRSPIHIIEGRLNQLLTLNIREYLRKWLPLSVFIGIVGGLGAIAFQILLDAVWSLSYESFQVPWYLILLLPAAGGLMVGQIIRRLAPEAAGHGTDSVIDSLHHKGGRMRIGVVPVKVVASALTIGTGGSAGREGPIAQIGAGLASTLGSRLKLSRSDLRIFVVAGMAAGFSAIFKAPLGSAVFAMEVPYKNDMEHNAVIPSMVSSVVAYLVFVPFYGVEPIFEIADAGLSFTVADFPFIFVLGILVGMVGVIFIRLFYFTRDVFYRIRVPFFLRTGLGGLMVGVIGLAVPQVLGLGAETIQLLIDGGISSVLFLLALAVGKMVATSFSIGSGGSGGVFFPSLMIGGAVGGIIGVLFGHANMPLFVVVGMGAMMSGVTKTPVATSIMITEMVGGFIVLIPVMIASVISYILTGRNTIYQMQIAQRSFSLDISTLSMVRVRDVMVKDPTNIPVDATIAEALRAAKDDPHYLYPVVDENYRILGVAPRERIEQVGERLPDSSVMQVMQSHFESISANEEALEAFETMNAKQISRMVVVDPEDPRRVVGIITRFDILNALEHLDERHHEY
ncbi:MAG: chloride channel protein [Methanomassiliicoccales archaeon]